MYTGNDNSENKIMREYYKMIGEAHIENTLDELEENREEINKINTSDKLDNWFEEYHRGWKRKQNREKAKKNIKKISARVAIFFAIFISATTIITMSVEAFRIRFINLIISQNDSYMEIHVDTNDMEIIPPIDNKEFYYLSYLTDGYVFEEVTVLDEDIYIIYANGSEFLYFSQVPGETNYRLNTEDAIVIDVKVNEYDAMYFEHQNTNMLFWNQENYTFLLDASLPKEELIKLAENMIKNK